MLLFKVGIKLIFCVLLCIVFFGWFNFCIFKIFWFGVYLGDGVSIIRLSVVFFCIFSLDWKDMLVIVGK